MRDLFGVKKVKDGFVTDYKQIDLHGVHPLKAIDIIGDTLKQIIDEGADDDSILIDVEAIDKWDAIVSITYKRKATKNDYIKDAERLDSLLDWEEKSDNKYKLRKRRQ